MKYIQLTPKNRIIILELFGKIINKKGYVEDGKTGRVETCHYSKELLKADSFSIIPGTATFVSNKAYCFAEHLARHR